MSAAAEAGTIRIRFSTSAAERQASRQNQALQPAMAVAKARCGRSMAILRPPTSNVGWAAAMVDLVLDVLHEPLGRQFAAQPARLGCAIGQRAAGRELQAPVSHRPILRDLRIARCVPARGRRSHRHRAASARRTFSCARSAAGASAPRRCRRQGAAAVAEIAPELSGLGQVQRFVALPAPQHRCAPRTPAPDRAARWRRHACPAPASRLPPPGACCRWWWPGCRRRAPPRAPMSTGLTAMPSCVRHFAGDSVRGWPACG